MADPIATMMALGQADDTRVGLSELAVGASWQADALRVEYPLAAKSQPTGPAKDLCGPYLISKEYLIHALDLGGVWGATCAAVRLELIRAA